jgi:hypothetical protein
VINTHRPTSIYLNIILPAITSICTYNVGAFPLDQGRVLFNDFVMEPKWELDFLLFLTQTEKYIARKTKPQPAQGEQT